MSALRISVLRKSLSRHPLASFGRFCTSKSDDSNNVADGEEAKGALKNFMALSESSTPATGLWAKLRQESKPDKPTEPRPWTQAGGARVNSAGRSGASPSEGASGTSDSSSSSPQPRKAFNPRGAGGKKKPSQSSGGNSDGGGSGPGGGGFFGGGRKRRGETEEQLDEDDSDDEERRSVKVDEDGEEELPEDVAAALDEDKFLRDIENGKSIDTSTMDPIDAFFANAYYESHKTTSGTVREILVSNDFRRVRLPKPRSIRELVGAMTPNITSVPANTDAYKVGQDAFSVLSKNFYYNEPDKAFIANGIAKMVLEAEKWQAAEHVRDQTEPDECELVGPLYDVFHPKFKRGYEMYLEEKKQARKLLAEGAGPSTYSVGFTDWDNEAVADEDQFNNENAPMLSDLFPDLQEEEDAQSLLDEEPREVRKKKKSVRDVKKKRR